MHGKSVLEIRQAFLDFFSKKGHKIIESSSLIPEEDSSLLFTNSGMNQFKNIFLGLDIPDSHRVVTAQRCVRAGGKHNDLEQVGYTNHHLTFFEMLGNFSFGDYFKEDAICFAWELLTSSHWFNLSKEKLFVTVYSDDERSYNIWKNTIGIVSERIICVGNKKINGNYYSDNFWQMGDVGPCGPCSEIFYSYTEDVMDGITAKDIEDKKNNNCCVEVWNLVFMEFNRQFDGTLLPLPILSVDTGMGLERISSVLQSVNNNYNIDLFYHLMTGIVSIIGDIDFQNQSLRVITDHIRTCSFLISDGVSPSNEGRGYVLRRIIRRAIRHGKILGIHDLFFHKLVAPLISVMGHSNHQLIQNRKDIEDILFDEEEKFSLVLEKGLDILRTELLRLASGDVLNGEKAFYFYSTYGFPLQFTKNICFKNNIQVDEIGFNRAMLVHKQSSQKSNKFMINTDRLLLMNRNTEFVGYENLLCSVEILSLFKDNKVATSLFPGECGIVILDKTPFYGESGGQIGDCGVLKTELICFEVLYTKKYGRVFCHWGRVVSGILNIGDHVIAQVNSENRTCISLNHSATHLLHAALIDVLGNNVLQKGSFINNQYLRFDFSYNISMSSNQICLVENIVNQKIQNNLLIDSIFLPLNIALNKGAKTVFGKQYNDIVRVLSIGNFSIELCGGTHVKRTGDIGFFIIFNECSIGTGIRRIEAICGMEALFFFHKQRKLIQDIEIQVKGHGNSVLKKTIMLCNRIEELERTLKRFKDQQIANEIERLIENIRYIGNIKLIFDQVNDISLQMLRVIVSSIKSKLISGIIIISCLGENNILHLVVGVTQDLIYYVNAIEIVNYLNDKIGGRGGGDPSLAQCGGGNVKLLSSAIEMLDIFLIKRFEH